MSKNNKNCNKSITDKPIILNTLKIQPSYVCPNCGEKHHTYMFSQWKQKIIDIGYYFKAAFLREIYDYERYSYLICGYKWKIRKYIEN